MNGTASTAGKLCAALLGTGLILIQGQPAADALVTCTISATISSIITLQAGSLNGSTTCTAITSANTTGATVTGATADQQDFTTNIDFGDLARGDGNPVVATVAVRVRSNTPYKITMARTSFNANNLQYKGRDVSGTADGGSFIKVSAGPEARNSGSQGNAGGCLIAARLTAGIPLSDLTAGSATAASTLVASGKRASFGGSKSSAGNAVDIPLHFECPTGMDIGPVSGEAGTFQGSVQINAFPGV